MPAALPELLASRLLPEQVEQEAAWRTAMPGYDYLATQPNVVLDFAETKVGQGKGFVVKPGHNLSTTPTC